MKADSMAEDNGKEILLPAQRFPLWFRSWLLLYFVRPPRVLGGYACFHQNPAVYAA